MLRDFSNFNEGILFQNLASKIKIISFIFIFSNYFLVLYYLKQKSDRDELTNMFHYACPKFLSPVPPNFEGVTDQYLMEPYNQQLKVFMDEVQQQLLITDIRSFLKLYTTLPISKLASFINKVSFLEFFFILVEGKNSLLFYLFCVRLPKN